MAYQRFLIGYNDTNGSLQTDLRPWLIADNAFEKLQNAYQFRGRIRKRFGSEFMGRFAINLGNTDGSGNFSATVPGAVFKVGQSFSVGPTVFTVYQTGTPAVMLNTGSFTSIGTTDGSGNASGIVPGAAGALGNTFKIGTQLFTVVVANGALSTTGIGSGTFNTATGAYTFTGAAANTTIFFNSVGGTYNTSTGAVVITGAGAATAVLFYPAEPVMGLTNYEQGPINDQPSYGFDTQFAYLFNGTWSRSGTALWHGNNTNFFWTTNWRGATPDIVVLFVTNFNATVPTPGANDDPIWWTTNGSAWTAGTGANAFYFKPAGGAVHTGPFVATAKIIVPFKNRLLLLNTIENDGGMAGGTNSAHKSRCRYSFSGSPFATNAWYEPNQIDAAGNVAGGAAFVDAATDEAIVTAEFLKDRLIVYFERSTWELVYTNNQVWPFVWQKINTELGAEATFSVVPFDKVVLGIGNTGIHACSGTQVERIDNKIPQEVFQIKVNQVGRVAGIRDYFTELVYWTFPTQNQSSFNTYPNQVLVYNYKTSTWALNDDCVNVWGYFEQASDTTWQSSTDTWEQADYTWDSGVLQAQSRQVIAGNQQGYTFIINPDLTRNAPVMQITNITTTPLTTLTIIDHTLNLDDWVLIENAQGVTGLNGNIYLVIGIVNANTVEIINPVTNQAPFTGTYTGGGTVSRVSNIGILSKQWNPYNEAGRDVYVAKIDFLVDKTENGEVTVDYYPSSTTLSMITAGEDTGAIMGTSVLETAPYALVPLEDFQHRLWHPVYMQTEGECIQINVYMSNEQMVTPAIAFSDFELHSLTLYTMPTTSRMQ